MAQLRHWVLLAAHRRRSPRSPRSRRATRCTRGTPKCARCPTRTASRCCTETRRRTPSGLLYPYPPEPFPLSDLGSAGSGAARSSPATSGSTATRARRASPRYAERKDGALLDLLDLELWRPESGDYLMLRVGQRRPARPVLRSRGRPRGLGALPRLVQRRAAQLHDGRRLACTTASAATC